MAVTSELSIRYLRPAIGTVLYAKANLQLVAKRSVVGTVEVCVDDNPERIVSVAQGTHIRPVANAG
jgi:acyl-coenzyme A thioesterase PaaI-like protein